MPMQAAVKHLELAGPITHEMILPTVIICICDLIGSGSLADVCCSDATTWSSDPREKGLLRVNAQ